MRIFILLIADRLPFLSVHFSGHSLAILDIYLSVLFQFVHFNGHSLAILNIYLSALSKFVHFSGHPSFSCIT